MYKYLQINCTKTHIKKTTAEESPTTKCYTKYLDSKNKYTSIVNAVHKLCHLFILVFWVCIKHPICHNFALTNSSILCANHTANMKKLITNCKNLGTKSNISNFIYVHKLCGNKPKATVCKMTQDKQCTWKTYRALMKNSDMNSSTISGRWTVV